MEIPRLDYKLKTIEERRALVEHILSLIPSPTPKYLEILSDYLVIPVEKEERRQRRILTDNRLYTINERETSLEGLTEQLENGEDGIYNLLAPTTKSAIFKPKVSITKEDRETIPFLGQLTDTIARWEALLATARDETTPHPPRDAFIIKKALIDMRKDQYAIKNAYKRPIIPTKLTRSKPITQLADQDSVSLGEITTEGFSLCSKAICQVILTNYSRLKQESYGDFESDLYALMMDFDNVSGRALADHPALYRIVELKIDGRSNAEIQQILISEFNRKHSLEYISSLWRNKIPKLIAAQAEKELLDWHYLNVEKGKYKKCSRCGQIKLAHPKYFSKNSTSKDGFYSLCKACRSEKRKNNALV